MMLSYLPKPLMNLMGIQSIDSLQEMTIKDLIKNKKVLIKDQESQAIVL